LSAHDTKVRCGLQIMGKLIGQNLPEEIGVIRC